MLRFDERRGSVALYAMTATLTKSVAAAGSGLAAGVRGRDAMLPMNARNWAGAEAVARRLAGKPHLEHGDVLAVLRALPFAQNAARRNVMAEGVPWIYSQCCGLTPSGLRSKLVNRCPAVAAVLARFGKQSGAACGDDARYPFTSITMNFNYQSKVHKDTFHVGGRSRIIALGDFDGGELWVEGTGNVDVHGRWYDFDGTASHKTLDFAGERYSLIYFVHESALYVEERDELEALGYSWPPGA